MRNQIRFAIVLHAGTTTAVSHSETEQWRRKCGKRSPGTDPEPGRRRREAQEVNTRDAGSELVRNPKRSPEPPEPSTYGEATPNRSTSNTVPTGKIAVRHRAGSRPPASSWDQVEGDHNGQALRGSMRQVPDADHDSRWRRDVAARARTRAQAQRLRVGDYDADLKRQPAGTSEPDPRALTDRRSHAAVRVCGRSVNGNQPPQQGDRGCRRIGAHGIGLTRRHGARGERRRSDPKQHTQRRPPGASSRHLGP